MSDLFASSLLNENGEEEVEGDDSENNPFTLEQWQEYVSQLHGHDLYEKALGANTLQFVQAVRADGLTAADTTTLLRMFAVRLQQDGQVVPGTMSGHYLDLSSLLGHKQTGTVQPKTAQE